MRGRLKYGVPIAAGLATGGYALSQGEDPGSAALAGIGGALGGAAGLLGARALAGKYGPMIAEKAAQTSTSAQNRLLDAATNVREGGIRQDLLLNAAEAAGRIPGALTNRRVGKGAAAAVVPVSALAAGLGGVALGAVPGAMGLPGFQQNAPIDPEHSLESSNTVRARHPLTTMQYGIS